MIQKSEVFKMAGLSTSSNPLLCDVPAVSFPYPNVGEARLYVYKQ
jgi:hypothetical protein